MGREAYAINTGKNMDDFSCKTKGIGTLLQKQGRKERIALSFSGYTQQVGCFKKVIHNRPPQNDFLD